MKYEKFFSKVPETDEDQLRLYQAFNSDEDSKLVTSLKTIEGMPIEIQNVYFNPYQSFDEETGSRTLHECVDWNTGIEGGFGENKKSHSTRVRGLKSLQSQTLCTKPSGRTLHECVDWNNFATLQDASLYVALYTSAWIEIECQELFYPKFSCRTLHECVDWNIGEFSKQIG